MNLFPKKSPKEWWCHASLEGKVTCVDENFTKSQREAGEDLSDDGFRFWVEGPTLEDAMYAAGVRARRLVEVLGMMNRP